MIDQLSIGYGVFQEWLMHHIILPFLHRTNNISYSEEDMDGLDLFLLGLLYQNKRQFISKIFTMH